MTQQQDLFEVKRCSDCGEIKAINEFHKNKSSKDGLDHRCKTCTIGHNKKQHKKNNPTRMWVNSKYIVKTHPLHKPGRYKTFEDAAFSSLERYDSSKEGQVYVITNPNFPEWVKVGMAVDAEDRLNNYQTSSPFRDYTLVSAWSVTDRRSAESEAHQELQKLYDRRSEWFRCTAEQAKEVCEKTAESYQ